MAEIEDTNNSIIEWLEAFNAELDRQGFNEKLQAMNKYYDEIIEEGKSWQE